MGRSKIIALVAIALGTLLSIVYLIYQAKELEKYTSAPMDGSTAFIIYSSDGGGLKDGTSCQRLLEECKNSLETFGYETIYLEGRGDEVALRERIQKDMKGGKRYILLDVNAAQTPGARNMLLVKVSSRYKDRYKENAGYAAKIKEGLKSSRIRVSIIAESRGGLNQDLGYGALRFEFSRQNSLKEALDIVVSSAYSLTR